MWRRRLMFGYVMSVLSVQPLVVLAAEAKPATPPAPQEDAAAKQAKAVARLDGTQWTITLSPSEPTGKSSGPMTDQLTFDKGKLTSEVLAKKGYESSNVSVSVHGDTIVWETMQSREKAGAVFWRGELRGARMQGVLSKKNAEGKADDYSFVAAEVITPPPAPPVPTAATPVTPAGSPAPEMSGKMSPTHASAETPAVPATPQAPASAKQEKPRKKWF